MVRPPRRLLIALLATSSVVTIALVTLGWRVIVQQRAIGADQARRQVDSDAEAAAARIRERLAVAGARLSGLLSHAAWSDDPIEDGAVVVSAGDTVAVYPSGALPFVPIDSAQLPLVPALATIEADEHSGGNLEQVARRYHALADAAGDPHVRAGALLRLGRVTRKSGDLSGALRAYDQLVQLGSVETDQLPAELVGLDGQRVTLIALHQSEHVGQIATKLASYLDAGRWQLTRGMAELYRDRVGVPPRRDSWSLAAALADEWHAHPTAWPERGQSIHFDEGRPVLVQWRASGSRIAAETMFFDRFVDGPSLSASMWRLDDGDGRTLAGVDQAPAESIGHVVGAGTPWTLKVWRVGPQTTSGSSGDLVLTLLIVALSFVWSATYFIVRAIRRESEVSRLQTDFVAAVSHEFRSPLTSIRQMAEMLDMGRVLDDARRRQYYTTLARESSRLQHLVETLLDFGRIEAGAHRHQPAQVDLAQLVRGVVGELASEAQAVGATVEIDGPTSGPSILADEHTLRVAIRNLIDNAIKYGRGAEAVRVVYGSDAQRVRISVIDRGPGLSSDERRQVFDKFFRGRAAGQGNVRGTGVGLAMVRQIARAHGGDVRVESEPAQGSTFVIEVPVASPANTAPVFHALKAQDFRSPKAHRP